jgi:hypothetical protein
VYPVFSRFFERDYLEYLLGVHDRIIRRGRELLEVLKGSRLVKGWISGAPLALYIVMLG